MRIVVSDLVLDSMTIFRWSLRGFRVTEQYFEEHMRPRILEQFEGPDSIFVRLGSGKEIPVVIDNTVEGYKVEYNMK